jgi:3-phenylpropionate/trans-cinnamate dioxygenase ferredoxin component
VDFVPVALEGEVPPAGTKEVLVDHHRILLVRDTDGSIHALQATCPHQDLPLAGGSVWRGVLTCPWHNFQWDLRTGENCYPKNVYPLASQPHLARQVERLAIYPARVTRGQVEIGLPAGENGDPKGR